MTLYQQYLELNMDTSWIGLEKSEEPGNFCTPAGARIIGWECEGIHYCFIESCGEMVFAVNPDSCTDKVVYPLARSFSDFLSLVLAGKSTTPLEQIIWMDKEQFNRFLLEHSQIEPAQTKVLQMIQTNLHLSPHPAPYEYVRNLQAEFDYSRIRLKDEYYDLTGFERP